MGSVGKFMNLGPKLQFLSKERVDNILFDRLLGGAMGIQGGKKWAAMRAHFDPEFSRNASMDKVPLYHDEAIRWLKGLVEPSASSSSTAPASSGSFVHNIADACRLLPFRLIGLVIYGEVFDLEVRSR